MGRSKNLKPDSKKCAYGKWLGFVISKWLGKMMSKWIAHDQQMVCNRQVDGC